MGKTKVKQRARSSRKSNSPYAKDAPGTSQDVSEQEDGNALEEQNDTALSPEIAALIKSKVDSLISEALSKTTDSAVTQRSNPVQASIDQSNSGQQAISDMQPGPRDESSSDGGTCRVSKSKGRKPSKSKRKPSKSVNSRKSTKKATRRRKEETTEEEVSDLDQDGVSSVEDYETDSEEEAPRQSFGMLVGQNLPQKQREKIKQGKFVEMSDLLPQNYTKKGSVVFKMSATKGMQALKQSTNTFVTLEQWNEAFAVYMSVRVETSKSKQEAVTMMKEMITYQRDINSLSKQNLQCTTHI